MAIFFIGKDHQDRACLLITLIICSMFQELFLAIICWILEFMSGHVITLTTCPKHQNYPNFFLSPKVANVIDKVAYIQSWWRLKCSFWEKLAKRDVPHILRGSRTHPAPILSLKYSEPTSNWIFLANQYFFKSINDTFQIQTFLQISRTCLEALRCFSYSLLKKNLPPPAKCFQPTQLILRFPSVLVLKKGAASDFQCELFEERWMDFARESRPGISASDLLCSPKVQIFNDKHKERQWMYLNQDIIQCNSKLPKKSS